MSGMADLTDAKLLKMQKTVFRAFEWISYFIKVAEATMPVIAVYADCDVLSMNDMSFDDFTRNTLNKLGLNDSLGGRCGYAIMYVDDERARMLVWNGYMLIGGTAAYYCEYDFVGGVESCYCLTNNDWCKVLTLDASVHAFERLFYFVWKSFYNVKSFESTFALVRGKLRCLDYTGWHYDY